MTIAEFGQIVTGGTAVLLLGFAGYGLSNLRFKIQGTGFFVALTLAGVIWCIGYSIEKAQTLVDGFLFAAQIEYLGLTFLPMLWLLVALSWMEHPLVRLRAFRALVLGTAALVTLLVWTNDLHHWWYASIVPTGRKGFAHFEPGPLYFPGFGVLTSTFVFSTIALFVRGRAIPGFRQKAPIIIAANLIPPLFALAFQLGFRPGGLDPTIFSLIPSFSVLAYGLFRHDFLAIVPVARETVVESMDHPVLVFDRFGNLLDHNAASRKHLGPFEDVLKGLPEPRGEFNLTLPDGERWFRFRRTLLKGPAGQNQGTVVLLTDVTEERRLLGELTHQASHDALTGLANRRHFEETALSEITRAARHGGTLALVLFDLDWFKSINDRFGHPSGDAVLKTISVILGPRLRTYDLLARVGGEEFAVLMPEANPVEAREAAERWRAALESTPQVLPGAVLSVTASFGVATLNDLPLPLPESPRLRLDALLGLADKSLYRAKAEGRNRVC